MIPTAPASAVHAASLRMLRGLQALTVTMTVMSTMRMGTHGRAVPPPPLGTGEPRLQPLLLNVAEKLLTDSQTALNDYMQEVMPPCRAQSGCEELLGKEFPAMLPTNVNNCSQAALNTSHDLCMKNIWRNLKIFEMYLQLITENSGRQLRLKHVNTDMKHLMNLIHSQFGLEEQQDIHDLKVTAENLEELMGTWSKKVFTARVLHLFIHQIEVVVRTFLMMNTAI
ncbi:uncharacterized protein LOC116940919 [Petromyzon marinus]|uniref:Uncharacterized protein LOC116940919 n=1 Tax=Petromyzon marinus TaxID=7757 RepID=A0AAJ7SX56_PETMA|nr:uncharacterized protein LOC116940919 [Petromyzon marinus]